MSESVPEKFNELLRAIDDAGLSGSAHQAACEALLTWIDANRDKILSALYAKYD